MTGTSTAPVSRSSEPNVAGPQQRGEVTDEDLFNTDEFRMYAYKILPCPKRGVHEWSTCPYSHPNEKARRRDPRIYNYLAIPCEATKQGGTCPRGDDCPNCHSLFEYWLHPSRYRTQLCRDMQDGHCKRSVCFFAHSIEELRVPDHSHLNIPPEMQAAAAAAAASGSSASSQTSSDNTPASSSDSGSSTPRASSSRESDSSSKGASKPPHSGSAKALNISNSFNRPASRASRYCNSPSPTTQWGGFAGTPSATALLGNACSSPDAYYNPATSATAALERQRAVLQLQHCQMQAQGLSPAGSLYEQQLQQALLVAQAGTAHAQQQAQLMMLQQTQQAAAWGAQLARSSMGSVKGSSPPLSPMPASLLERPASFGGDNCNFFVPPSAHNSAMSTVAAAQAGWQSASLLRSLSSPAHTGSGSFSSDLLRQSSGFAGMGTPASAADFASSACASVQLQNSGGSLVDGQQDVTLASLLAASSQGLGGNSVGAQSWGAPAMSLGLTTSAGLPMGCGSQGALGSGSLLGDGMDATASLLLLQQQMQQKAALGNAVNLLQSMNRGEMGLGNGNGQTVNDMLGAMMQQLMLQQQSVM